MLRRMLLCCPWEQVYDGAICDCPGYGRSAESGLREAPAVVVYGITATQEFRCDRKGVERRQEKCLSVV